MGMYRGSNKLSGEPYPLFLWKQTLQEGSSTNDRIGEDTGKRANRSQRAWCKAELLHRGTCGHRRSSKAQTITLIFRGDSWTEEHERVESRTIERRISAPCLTITNSLQSGTQSFSPDGMMQIENKP